ncbi:MAG: zinc ribbon domain-containing protein [Hydrogenophaga sp.]|uniref:zinc ribbon domain-containing protein n=1 Tax=Hydrogenophaga sp. TaxID=1904254 RepID=UPI00274CDB23|nr:zinc ribbon domain-containing protein [Hydrogenophaga sp.]MDP2417420.1 zinc ribbon domain-containing protein [Hydrogenophaga sp.]MDZ4189931.1 zinc ribbon domain-containing protein [Hydrogenophaga sp.]
MALVKCSDCEKEVSKNAKTCPHCGKDTPGISNASKVIQFIIGGAIGALFMIWLFD